MSDDDRADVLIRLSADEALVLFEWLSRYNEACRETDFEDQAEQRALWNLNGALEAILVEPLAANYDELLAAARARLRDDVE